MSDDEKIIRTILEYMHDEFKKESRSTVMAEDLVEPLKLQENVARGYMQRLSDKGWITTPYKERDMYVITDLGIRNLETLYNPEYMKELSKIQILERDKEKDALQRERSNLTYTKIGVISGIILGATGLIVAIVALLK